MTTNEDLFGQLQRIERQLLETNKAYQEEARKRDIRIDAAQRATVWNRRVAAIVAVLAVIAISIGVGGWRAQVESNNERTSSRIAGCEQFNVQQRLEVDAAARHDLALANILSPPPRTAAQQADVATALKQLHQASVDGHPLRDCSPKGIKAYLSGDTTTTTEH